LKEEAKLSKTEERNMSREKKPKALPCHSHCNKTMRRRYGTHAHDQMPVQGTLLASLLLLSGSLSGRGLGGRGLGGGGLSNGLGRSGGGVPDSRAGEGVGLGVVPLVEGDTGIGRLVNTGDLDGGAELGGARRLDLDLEALNVELGLAYVSFVETNVLDTDKVWIKKSQSKGSKKKKLVEKFEKMKTSTTS
jgi:hypothetical protein